LATRQTNFHRSATRFGSLTPPALIASSRSDNAAGSSARLNFAVVVLVPLGELQAGRLGVFLNRRDAEKQRTQMSNGVVEFWFVRERPWLTSTPV
jgi:hypothetical protein